MDDRDRLAMAHKLRIATENLRAAQGLAQRGDQEMADRIERALEATDGALAELATRQPTSRH